MLLIIVSFIIILILPLDNGKKKKVISKEIKIDSIVEKINDDNYHINIYRARPVVIVDGMTRKFIMSASYDAETLAKQAGLTLYDGDVVKEKINTTQVLEAGLTDTYEIKRKGGKTITVEEEIPYTEKTEQDSSLAAGQKKVKQIGELGKRVITYQARKSLRLFQTQIVQLANLGCAQLVSLKKIWKLLTGLSLKNQNAVTTQQTQVLVLTAFHRLFRVRRWQVLVLTGKQIQ